MLKIICKYIIMPMYIAHNKSSTRTSTATGIKLVYCRDDGCLCCFMLVSRDDVVYVAHTIQMCRVTRISQVGWAT